jgi:hypothetical protein
MNVVLKNIETNEIYTINLVGVSNINNWIFEGGFDRYKDDYIIEYIKDNSQEWDNMYAKSIIDNEGIGYAVQSYCDAYYFEDPVTRELWRNAKSSLDKLAEYLEKEDERI